MPQYEATVTITRRGHLAIEAETAEEAKKLFDELEFDEEADNFYQRAEHSDWHAETDFVLVNS